MKTLFIRRLLQQASRQAIPQRRSKQQGGYALPLVLVIAVALVGGAAALASRTGSLGFGAAFQKQTWDARSIAQFGLSTLVTRLNKEQNRGLLAAADVDGRLNDSDYETIWNPSETEIISERHRNPCAVDASNNRLEPNLGDIFPEGKKDDWWYVNSSGEVTTSRANAVGRFRLIDNPNIPTDFRVGSKQELAAEPQPSGKTTAVLSVEAISMQNGRDVSRTVVEALLDVTPKCCRVTFGSMSPSLSEVPRHGNNDYTRTYSANNPFGASQCTQMTLDPDSFGLVWGADGNGGTFSSSGTPTVCIPDSDGTCDPNDPSDTYINPLACVSPDPDACTSGSYNGLTAEDEKVEPIDTKLPPAPEYYPSITTPPTPRYSALVACGARIPGTNRNETCNTITPQAAGNTPLFKFLLTTDTTGRTYINGNASNLPSYCNRADVNSGGDGSIHCVINQIVLPSNKSIQFYTGYRTSSNPSSYIPTPIRLYFPQDSVSLAANNRSQPIISQTGNSGIEHCVELTTNPSSTGQSQCRGDALPARPKITQLSMFGCNPLTQDELNSGKTPYYGVTCGEQLLSYNGTPSSFGYFSYFPKGKMEFFGTTTLSGVFWTDNLTGRGTPNFYVPASGVSEAFELLGINPGENSSCSGSIYGECRPWEPKWDFVARSIRSLTYRFG